MEIETQPTAARSASLAVHATDGELLMRFNRHRDQEAFAQVVGLYRAAQRTAIAARRRRSRLRGLVRQ